MALRKSVYPRALTLGLREKEEKRRTSVIAAWRLRAVLLAVVVAVQFGLLAANPASSSAATVGPAGLAFYKPPPKLPSGSHGTLIWARPLHGPAALAGAVNERVLYTQVGIRGKLVAVSGIVSIPKGKAPKRGWPIVTWAHGTTGIADRCAPSRAAGPSSGAYSTDVGTRPLLERWIEDGWAVVRTDYEGLGTPGPHPYLIGRSEGHAVLDIVRAARELDPALGRRVIVSGHSQGGHATLWAASLASSYTPNLDVLGAVAFAPQSHTAQEASFLRTLSSPALTPAAAMVLRGLNIAYSSLRVGSLLTPAASRLFPQTLAACATQLSSTKSFGGLPLDRLVSASANIAPIVRKLLANDPDHLKIKSPVLIEQGLADETVVPAFDQELSQSLAKVGDSVAYHTYLGVTHNGVLVAAASDATAFIKKHFDH